MMTDDSRLINDLLKAGKKLVKESTAPGGITAATREEMQDAMAAAERCGVTSGTPITAASMLRYLRSNDDEAVCPKCGSKNLNMEMITTPSFPCERDVACGGCNARWVDVVDVVGVRGVIGTVQCSGVHGGLSTAVHVNSLELGDDSLVVNGRTRPLLGFAPCNGYEVCVSKGFTLILGKSESAARVDAARELSGFHAEYAVRKVVGDITVVGDDGCLEYLPEDCQRFVGWAEVDEDSGALLWNDDGVAYVRCVGLGERGSEDEDMRGGTAVRRVDVHLRVVDSETVWPSDLAALVKSE